MHYLIVPSIIGLLVQFECVVGQCFSDSSMNAQWAQIINGDDTSTEFSVEGSCCQETVCALPCAEEVPPPAKVSACMKLRERLFVECSNDVCISV